MGWDSSGVTASASSARSSHAYRLFSHAATTYLGVLTTCLAGLAFMSGCGKSPEVALVPVSGQIFYQSQPAQEALVIFHPTTGASPENWPHGLPHAVVAPDGTFKVSLPPLGEGAPAGDYKVLVTWQMPVPGSDPENTEPETEDRLKGRWATPEKSTLMAKVLAPTTELPRFDIK